VPELRVIDDPVEAIEWLVACETEAVDALQAAIEPTGREGRSEALEHLLEHLIMRKQAQIDFLRRANKRSGWTATRTAAPNPRLDARRPPLTRGPSPTACVRFDV
jgi:hypothetical protein